MSEVLSKFSCDHIPEGDSCCLVVTLVEQNAKLRGLVRDLYYETKSPSNHATQVEIRMNELGIEVN